MDVSSQPPDGRQRVSGKRRRSAGRRIRWGILLWGCLALLLGLALQMVMEPPGSHIALSAPLGHPGANAANPADATATPAPSGPPTLTLAVPSSGKGPVGAHLTVIGSNWGSQDVLIGAAAPGLSCNDTNNWAQTFNHARPRTDQSIVFSFYWPNSLTATGGPYSICASNNVGVASASYQLLSLSPPSLTLNPTTTTAGSLVNVSGENFVGSGSVTLSITNAQGKTRELTTLSPNESGAFSLTYQPRPTDTGDITLKAFTGAPQGMQPAIQVSAKLHVDVAATPTVEATPTVTGATTTNTTDKNNGSSVPLLVALAALILLALLGAVGAFVFFAMRRRSQPDNDAGYASARFGGSGPGNPGYGMPGNMYSDMYENNGMGGVGGMGNLQDSNWDAPTQGYYPAYDQSEYPPQPGYGRSGSGWPASDEPDPGWRPRPMTGQWRAPEGYGDDAPYSDYGAGQSGLRPPRDPWGTDQSFGGASRGGRGPGYPSSDPRRRPGSSPERGSSGRLPGAPRGQFPERPPDEDW